MSATEAPSLARTLNVFQLWGIAVGLVISGEYFGWSYGWAQAGTLGFLGILAREDGPYDATAKEEVRAFELETDTLLELFEDPVDRGA